MENQNEIRGLDFDQEDEQQTLPQSEYDLSRLLSFLANVHLVAGLIGAFIFGCAEIKHDGDLELFDDFNPGTFFGCLIGGFTSFAILLAFSRFVEVAKKYLNEQNPH